MIRDAHTHTHTHTHYSDRDSVAGASREYHTQAGRCFNSVAVRRWYRAGGSRRQRRWRALRWLQRHSPRVGMAQDLSAAGAELPEIMTVGKMGEPHDAGQVHPGPGRRQGSRSPVLPRRAEGLRDTVTSPEGEDGPSHVDRVLRDPGRTHLLAQNLT